MRLLPALAVVASLSVPVAAHADCNDGTLESLIQQMVSYANQAYGLEKPVTLEQKALREKLHLLAEQARINRPSDEVGACRSIIDMTQQLRQEKESGATPAQR